MLSQASAGTPQPEGKMQNRKGNDPSEMFDLREYVTGDDVRSIHWKLSGKTDTLILRQASAPSLYNIVLLMDFGIEKNGEPTPLEELNAAAAVAAAVGTQLVQQHITFSAAVPTRNGLEIYEVRTQKDFQQMLMHWMCFPLQQTEGAGMRYFLTQQMDRQYARLVLLTAGQYTASLKPLEGRIGTTVISAVSGGIVLEVYEERTVRSFLEHLVTTNKNTSFKTRFKLHYAGLLYPWFARAQKAQLTD